MTEPPKVRRVRLIERIDTIPEVDDPYLSLHRLRLENEYDDGCSSASYPYDAVLRKHLDAVAVVLTSGEQWDPFVCLRRCLRPPVLLRENAKENDSGDLPALWEIPAGLLEPADEGESGILERASLEVLEEAGYRVSAKSFTFLGTPVLVSPGVIPERLWFATARVDDMEARLEPKGDGSPVEEGALVEWTRLSDALRQCDEGEIEDMKTELGLRRLARRLELA